MRATSVQTGELCWALYWPIFGLKCSSPSRNSQPSEFLSLSRLSSFRCASPSPLASLSNRRDVGAAPKEALLPSESAQQPAQRLALPRPALPLGRRLFFALPPLFPQRRRWWGRWESAKAQGWIRGCRMRVWRVACWLVPVVPWHSHDRDGAQRQGMFSSLYPSN